MSCLHVMMVIIYSALIHVLVCQLVCGQEKLSLVKVSITASNMLINNISTAVLKIKLFVHMDIHKRIIVHAYVAYVCACIFA